MGWRRLSSLLSLYGSRSWDAELAALQPLDFAGGRDLQLAGVEWEY
jgi:hypothetical protein